MINGAPARFAGACAEEPGAVAGLRKSPHRSQSRKDAEPLLSDQWTVGSGVVSLKPGHMISSNSLQNPAYPDATYRKKRDEEHRGYGAHAVETCDPGNKTQVITHMDFEIESGLVMRCPAGHSPLHRSLEKDGTSKAIFSRSDCASYEIQCHCIVFEPNVNGRITVDENRRWLDRRAKELTDGTYQKLCRMRPPVEGFMEKLKPGYLRGRILFRGLIGVKSRMILRATGLNFRQYLLWLLLDLLYLLSKLIRTAGIQLLEKMPA